ncbi:uncharacterized protein [Clytia hemisphaerica]|uniref:uncharacterized protein isoform X2 n=1 Tax=Clytia hemisphaerica TaxID=252671 RepID=UPI0034D59C82
MEFHIFVVIALSLVQIVWANKNEDVGVVREIWSNVHGSDLQDLLADSRFPHQPTVVSFIKNFDAPPASHQKNIAQRVKGYFVAPQKGEYKFYSSCGGSCEVFLGLDGTEGENHRIINQQRSTRRNQFLKYPEQVSHTVTLKKGQITYLEAINKQGTDSDSLSVGVELPNGDKLFPIPHDLLRKSKSSAQTYVSKKSTSLRRRNLKSGSGAILDLEGKHFKNKDALEPGINIFQDSKDVMDSGDLGSGDSEDKISAVDKNALKTSDIISNDDIESINLSENKKLTNDKNSKTAHEKMTKSPVQELTGSERQVVGIGADPLTHGHMLGPQVGLPLIHPPTREDHHPDDITLTGAHLGNLPAQPLRHTGKVALVPAILHKTEYYDHATGYSRPGETRIEPVMNAHPVENWNHDVNAAGDLEHALGEMGGPVGCGQPPCGAPIHNECAMPPCGAPIHNECATPPCGAPAVVPVCRTPPCNLDHVDVHPFHESAPQPKKKPDIVKVEFVPEEAEGMKAAGNTKVGSKKGGSVRVQFIPGEVKQPAKTMTPEARAGPASSNQAVTQPPKQQPKAASISTGAIASKLKDKMEGKEEVKEPKNDQQPLKQQKQPVQQQRYQQPPQQYNAPSPQPEIQNTTGQKPTTMKYSYQTQPDKSSYYRQKHKVIKTINGYEADPQLPSMNKPTAPVANSFGNGGGPSGEVPASAGITREPEQPKPQIYQTPAGQPTSELRPGEEKIDPPFTALGQKYPEGITTEERDATAMGEHKPDLPVAPGQERVFFGGNGEPGQSGMPNTATPEQRNFEGPPGADIPPMSSPEASQPDPNPTQNAPNTATSASGGINPVAGELSNALAENKVSPEEALQMMNDFVSGNQDMNKAAKNIEGMLGQIAHTRHHAPGAAEGASASAPSSLTPEHPLLQPPADVASPLNDDTHKFVSNPNDIAGLNTGFSDPNLAMGFHKGMDTSVIKSPDLDPSMAQPDGSNGGAPVFMGGAQGETAPKMDMDGEGKQAIHMDGENGMVAPGGGPPGEGPSSSVPIEQEEQNFRPPEEEAHYQQPQGGIPSEQPQGGIPSEEPQRVQEEAPPGGGGGGGGGGEANVAGGSQQGESRQQVMAKLNSFSTNGPPPPVDVYEGQVPELNGLVHPQPQTQTGETRSPTVHTLPPQNYHKPNNMVMEAFKAPDDGYANPQFENPSAKIRKLIPDISSDKTPTAQLLDKMDPHEIAGQVDPSSMKHDSFSDYTSSLLETGGSKFDQRLVKGIEGDLFQHNKDISTMFSKPINSEFGDEVNQAIGRPMPSFANEDMGLATSQFERKFKTPHPVAVRPAVRKSKPNPQVSGKRRNMLADMYADSLFPEDNMDIASLQGSLQGRFNNKVRSNVPTAKPGQQKLPVKQGKLKTSKGRKFPITKKLNSKNPKQTKEQSKQKKKKTQTKKIHNKRAMNMKPRRKLFRKRANISHRPQSQQSNTKRTWIPAFKRKHKGLSAQRRQRVNQIKTDHASMRIPASSADNHKQHAEHSLITGGRTGLSDQVAKLSEDTNKIASTLNGELPQQEHASLRKLVTELKNVLHEIKESPQLNNNKKHTFLNGERQLTESDILNLEDVTKSDLLSAFASIKKVNEQREDQSFIHSNGMDGHLPQEVYEPPGFTSGQEWKRGKIQSKVLLKKT